MRRIGEGAVLRGACGERQQPCLGHLRKADTVGFKLAEGNGLREGCDSKELWRSVEKINARLRPTLSAI